MEPHAAADQVLLRPRPFILPVSHHGNDGTLKQKTILLLPEFRQLLFQLLVLLLPGALAAKICHENSSYGAYRSSIFVTDKSNFANLQKNCSII